MLERFAQFSSAISGIYWYMQNIERDEMIKYGFKGAYAQYLVAMHRHVQGLTATQLCAACGKDKAAVSRIISEMEEKGLVIRENDKDRVYRARIKLTETGQQAAEYVCERAKAAVDAVGKELPEENKTIFYETLDAIALKLQTISKEGLPQP